MPSISIVTPCYNAGMLIAELADNLASQTLRDFEWLIVDDGSDAETQSVLAEIVKRTDIDVQVELLDRCGGSACRNHGFQRSTGSHVKFLDADDLLDVTLLQHQWETAQQDLSAMVVSPKATIRLDGQKVLGKISEAALRDPLRHYLRSPWFMHGGCLLPRRLVDEIGGWDERLPAAQDLDFYRRLLLIAAPKVSADHRSSFYYRQHNQIPRISTPQANVAQKYEAQLQALDRFCDLLDERGRLDEYRSLLAMNYDAWACSAAISCPEMVPPLLDRANATCLDYPKPGGKVRRFLRSTLGIRNSMRILKSPLVQKINLALVRLGWRQNFEAID